LTAAQHLISEDREGHDFNRVAIDADLLSRQHFDLGKVTSDHL